LRKKLPELPAEKSKRFKQQFNLSDSDIEILVSSKEQADYFEEVVSELEEKINAKEFNIPKGKIIKSAANYIIGELRKHLIEKNQSIENIKITPENFADLIGFVSSGKINSSAAQSVLAEMYKTGGDPSQIIEEKNLAQVSDEGELESIVKKVIDSNEKSTSDYKGGKENALKYLMGQVMLETKGKANPQVVIKLLKEKLKGD